MPITMQQVVNALLPDEPDYKAAASLGPEAVPLLQQLILSANVELATKATSLAGHISTPEAAQLLRLAADSGRRTVRVAAASAARHLPPEFATPVLGKLISDNDAGVRKVALAAVPANAGNELRAAVSRAATADPNDHLRALATKVNSQLRP